MPAPAVELPFVAGVSHRHVDVSGLSAHVAETGAGYPLVLLHGWPQNWFCWRRLVPLLGDRYRLIMPDLRGHGWTGAPRRGYEKEQLATDLLGLLDALHLDQVGLVGHDWGAWTGFLACLRAPERFPAFLALGIVPPFQRMTMGKALQAWRGAYQVLLSTPLLAQAALQASPEFVAAGMLAATTRINTLSAEVRRFYGRVLQEPARAHASVQLYRTFLLRECINLTRYHHQRLVVPTRLLIGDGDPVNSPALLEGWESQADDMRVETLSGVGHFLPEEAPDAVGAAAEVLFG
jgi:pimeloyl-ACP methyl ester carboxylesterase